MNDDGEKVMYSSTELMSIGMDHLVQKLGQVEAERFISTIIRESSDYTKTRRLLFDDMTIDQVLEEATEYELSHPSEVPKP